MALEKTLFSGKDVDEALDKASQYYNVNTNLIQYRVVARDQSLFSPLSGELTIKVERIGKSNGKRKLPGHIFALENTLNEIIRKAKLDAKATYRGNNGALEFEINGRDNNMFVDNNGSLLDAFQYLVNRIASKKSKTNIVLECNDFRKNRIRELKDMAGKAAQKVKDFGKPYLFSPMNPAERRQIHLTLQDDRMIMTESIGDGFMKRVKVMIRKR